MVKKKTGKKRSKKIVKTISMAVEKKGGQLPAIVFFEKKMEGEIKSIEHELDATMHHAHFTLRVLALLLVMLASNVVFLFSVGTLDANAFAMAVLLNAAVIAAGFWLCLLSRLWISKTLLFASLCIIEFVLYTAKISAYLERIEAFGLFLAIDLVALAYLMKVSDSE